MDLRNKQFFHGTDQRFAPGQRLEPNAENFGRSYPDKTYAPGVYMTTDAARARNWAGNIAKNRGSSVGHVYEVEPQGGVTTNQLPFGEGKEHIAASAIVKSHVSATKVLNPGYEDMGFGSRPATLGKTYKGSRLTEFMGGGSMEPTEAKPKAPPQLKGQMALFGPGKVVDNAPQVNRRLHERDKRSGVDQPSIWDERNAADAAKGAEEAKGRKAMAGKVRTAMGRDQATSAIERARAMVREHDYDIQAIRNPIKPALTWRDRR